MCQALNPSSPSGENCQRPQEQRSPTNDTIATFIHILVLEGTQIDIHRSTHTHAVDNPPTGNTPFLNEGILLPPDRPRTTAPSHLPSSAQASIRLIHEGISFKDQKRDDLPGVHLSTRKPAHLPRLSPHDLIQAPRLLGRPWVNCPTTLFDIRLLGSPLPSLPLPSSLRLDQEQRRNGPCHHVAGLSPTPPNEVRP